MDVGTIQLILTLCGIGAAGLFLWALFGTASDYAGHTFDRIQKRAYDNRKKWDKSKH